MKFDVEMWRNIKKYKNTPNNNKTKHLCLLINPSIYWKQKSDRHEREEKNIISYTLGRAFQGNRGVSRFLLDFIII